jgi:hypothetical protein
MLDQGSTWCFGVRGRGTGRSDPTLDGLSPLTNRCLTTVATCPRGGSARHAVRLSQGAYRRSSTAHRGPCRVPPVPSLMLLGGGRRRAGGSTGRHAASDGQARASRRPSSPTRVAHLSNGAVNKACRATQSLLFDWLLYGFNMSCLDRRGQLRHSPPGRPPLFHPCAHHHLDQC